MSITPGIYEHYKGKSYEVIGEVFHSETRERMVLYKMLYTSDYPQGTFWVRPKSMFEEQVIVGGREVPRFRLITKKG